MRTPTIASLAAAIFLQGAAALADAVPHYPADALPWTWRQYSAFYFTHYNTNLALPHRRTGPSRLLFERLTSRENIDKIVAAPIGHQAKLTELAKILAAMGSIRASYNLAVIAGEPLQEESTEVQVFNLYLLAIYAELAGGDLSANPAASAMKTAFLGVVHSISEENVYSSAQVARLSDALARRFTILGPLFPDLERQDLVQRLSQLQSRQTNPQSRDALARLVATVEGG